MNWVPLLPLNSTRLDSCKPLSISVKAPFLALNSTRLESGNPLRISAKAYGKCSRKVRNRAESTKSVVSLTTLHLAISKG